MARILSFCAVLACVSLPAHAQQTVQVGGKQAILHAPAGAWASAILAPDRPV